MTIAIVAAGLATIADNARAADMLRVGKAVPEAFSFIPLDIGMQTGIFKKYGIDMQETAFAGDAKMQQAMAAGSIDVGLGSGPAMAFIAKGAPVKAIAAMAGPPLLLVIVVRPDGRQDSRRSQRQESQRHHRRFVDLFSGERNLTQPGLGSERHRHRADGCDGGPDRRA